MKTTPAFIGAIVAAAAVAVPFLSLGLNPLALGVVGALVIVGYIAGNATAGKTSGDVIRGILIGINTGLNVALLNAIGGEVLGDGAGAALAIGAGAVNFLAVFTSVSESEVYQGFLGWFNWLMPMSWLVLALGFGMFVLNLVGHVVLAMIFRVKYFRVEDMAADLKTGTFFTRGGWVSNANPIDTAFNMGNFSFVDTATTGWHMEHEAGHTLNLGAFGSVFHFIGAIDENITGGGRNAFSERMAESNDPKTTQANIIPMWV